MADESDTLADAGTDTVETSQTDTPDEWDYYDPDDDQDTVEITNEEGTEDEAGDTEDTPEEEPEEEPEDQAEETPEPVHADESAVVRLADGSETTVGELTKGYLRQSDYSRKMADVAERRKAIDADATRTESVTEALIDRLSQMIPEAPDPGLAYTDPNRFTAMKAQHDSAVAQVQQLVAVAQEAKGIKSKLSEEDQRAKVQEENLKLVEMFPQAGTQDGRKAFFETASSAALDLGFSEAEIQGQMDHRIFALAHYAKIGMEAEKAKVSAKAKVKAAAPTPQKKPGQGARKSNGNREAMKRLSNSGSIHDALKVDWE